MSAQTPASSSSSELDQLFEQLHRTASRCTDLHAFQINDRNNNEKLLRKGLQFKFDATYHRLANELTKMTVIDHSMLRLLLTTTQTTTGSNSGITDGSSSMQKQNQAELSFRLQNLLTHGMIEIRHNCMYTNIPPITEQWRTAMVKDLEIRRCDERIFSTWHEHIWVDVVERWFGQIAASLVRHICIHGFTSISSLLKLFGATRASLSSFDDSNKDLFSDISQTSNDLKRNFSQATAASTINTCEKIIMRLIRCKILMQVPQATFAQWPETAFLTATSVGSSTSGGQSFAGLEAHQRSLATLTDAEFLECLTKISAAGGEPAILPESGGSSSNHHRTSKRMRKDDSISKTSSYSDPLITVEATRLNELLWFDTFLHCKHPPLIFSTNEHRFLRCVFELMILQAPVRRSGMDIITTDSVDKTALQQLMLEHYPGMEQVHISNLIEFCMSKFGEEPGDPQVLGFLLTPGRVNIGKIARELAIEIISRTIDHKEQPFVAKVFKFICAQHPNIVTHTMLEQRMVTNRDKINSSLIWLVQKNLIMYKPVFKRENERFKGFRFCSTEYFVDLPVSCRAVLDLMLRQLLRNATFWEEHKTTCLTNEYTGSLIKTIIALKMYLKLSIQPNVREDESWQLASTFTYLRKPLRKVRAPVSIAAMLNK